MGKAAEAYWQSRFQDAEQIYSKCLTTLDNLFPGDSPDTATCLLGLGDTYFFQSRYLLALNHYNRLLAIRERLGGQDPTAIVTALLKLAKTHEKLNEKDQALHFYKRSLDIAQSRMFVGHPLLTNLLDSYASFLKREYPESGQHIDMEKKAKLSREKYVDPDEFSEKLKESGGTFKPAKNQLNTREDKKKKKQKEEVFEETPPPPSLADQASKQMIELTRTNLLLTVLIGMTLLMVLGLAGAGVYYGAVQGESPKNAVIQPGQSISTVDEDISLAFMEGGKVKKTIGKGSSETTYKTLSNPVTGMLFVMSTPGFKGPLYLKTEEGFTDNTGLLLQPAESADKAVFAKMKSVAGTLDSFIEKNKRLPDTYEEFLEFRPGADYVNPFSKRRQLPVFILGRWSDNGDRDKLGEILNTSDTFDTRKIDPTVFYTTLTKAISPGGVIIIAAPKRDAKEAGYFIVGGDKNGKLIKNCTGKAPLMLTGRPPAPSANLCPATSNTDAPSQEPIVVTSRALNSFFTLLVLSAIDAIFFLPVIFGWFVLAAYTDKAMISFGTMREKTKKIQRARMIYFPLVIVYLIFTVFVVAAAITGNII